MVQQRNQYKELMLQAYGGTGDGIAALQTPTKAAAAALNAVTGVFSTGKAKETIAQLTSENIELKKLERLRPQLMELQQRLAVVQKQADDAEAKLAEESASLSDHNRELAQALKQSQKTAEAANTEKDEALKLAGEWSAKASRVEREVTQLKSELEELRERLAEVTMSTIDPAVIEGLNEKISELESEFKFQL
jgi:chromosome segregation ATPase